MRTEDLSDCRILIVDDVKTNVDILVEALRGDYRLSIALSGGATLRVAEESPPDLVLLDIVMSGIDSYEVCRRLRGALTEDEGDGFQPSDIPDPNDIRTVLHEMGRGIRLIPGQLAVAHACGPLPARERHRAAESNGAQRACGGSPRWRYTRQDKDLQRERGAPRVKAERIAPKRNGRCRRFALLCAEQRSVARHIRLEEQ